MKSCELCKSPAKIFCDSDQAILCWTCDTKVHSANFLVARHSRSLLCRVCQSPTPWTAVGDKLPPSAVSVCEKCVVDGPDDDDDDDEDDDDSETELDVDDEDEDEGEDDNQVVPLSYTPPPAASSSSCDDYSDRDLSVKRKRVNEPDLSEDEDGCLSRQKDRREVFSPDFNEAIGEGNGGRMYNFIPLKSEGMNEKLKRNGHRDKISTVGLDLNLPDAEL